MISSLISIICFIVVSVNAAAPVVSIKSKIVLSSNKQFKELHCFVTLDNILFQVGGFYIIPGN